MDDMDDEVNNTHGNPPDEINNKANSKFENIIKDFIADVDVVFPEYKIVTKHPYDKMHLQENIDEIFDFCKKSFPEKFFDILYENQNVFDDELYLLPLLDFSNIWKSNISDETKSKIWKYLQLMLFSVVKQIDNPDLFGNASQLFDLLEENNLKDKLAETFANFNNIFNDNSMNCEFPFFNRDDNDEDLSGCDDFDFMDFDLSTNPFSKMKDHLPDMKESFRKMDEHFFNMKDSSDNAFNPEDLHEHISGLMKGNIGKLAKEIADDTIDELGITADDISNNPDPKKVFENLVKNPSKLMNVMQKISKKIDTKLKSGEVNQEELMTEAAELLKNMKNVPGMEDMMKKMAKQQMGGKGKAPSMNTIEANLQQKLSASKQRKKMLDKLNQRKNDAANTIENADGVENLTNANTFSDPTTEKTQQEIMESFITQETHAPRRSIPAKKKNKKRR